MAKIYVKGLQEYEMLLEQLGQRSTSITKKALYKGAGAVADELHRSGTAIPARRKKFMKPNYALTVEQRNAMMRQLKISRFNAGRRSKKEDGVNTFVGIYGYTDYYTEDGDSMPAEFLLRIAEKQGQKWVATPFVKQAIRRSKPIAEARMQETIEAEITRIQRQHQR